MGEATVTGPEPFAKRIVIAPALVGQIVRADFREFLMVVGQRHRTVMQDIAPRHDFCIGDRLAQQFAGGIAIGDDQVVAGLERLSHE